MRRVGPVFGIIFLAMIVGGLYLLGKAALYEWVANNEDRTPAKLAGRGGRGGGGGPRGGAPEEPLADNEVVVNYTGEDGKPVREKFLVDPAWKKSVTSGGSVVIHHGPVYGKLLEGTHPPMWQWIAGGLLVLLPFFVLLPAKRAATPEEAYGKGDVSASMTADTAVADDPTDPSVTAETPPS